MVKKNTTEPVSEVVETSNTGLVKKVENTTKKEVKKTKVKTEEKIELKKEELPKIIVDLHNDGLSTSKIGLILKEKYKIFNVKKFYGKTILAILNEKNIQPELPEDLSNLLRRAVKLLKHMKVNKKDTTSKRGYQITVSKIRRLAKYYKRIGKLPNNWNYSEEKAAILVK